MASMNFLEDERTRIEKRIKQILNDKENAGMDRTIVIAGGSPVLDNQAEEYVALKRLQRVLDSHEPCSVEEYFDTRHKTQLGEISDVEIEVIKSYIENTFETSIEKDKEITRIKSEEIKRITAEMHAIEDSYVKATGWFGSTTAKNGRRILKDDKEKYNCLLDLLEIISKNYDEADYAKYMEIRSKTALEKLDEKDIAVLVGSKAIEIPVEEEKKPVEVSSASEETISREDYEKMEHHTKEEEYFNDLRNDIKKQHEKANQDKTIATLDGFNTEKRIAVYGEPQKAEEEEMGDTRMRPLDNGTQASNREEPEELFEVVKMTPWEWTKKHKKQILIALGITALSISAVVLITNILPALMAATAEAAKANQIAGMATSMINNSNMWASASAAEQAALHGANRGLASALSNLTGVASSFKAAAGTWSFGAQSMAEFASSAVAQADIAAKAVSSLTASRNAALLLGGLGAGLTGTGLLLGKGKISKEYREIKKEMNELAKKANLISQDMIHRSADIINGRIIKSETLSEKEKTILLKKLNNILKRMQKNKVLDREHFISANYDAVNFVGEAGNPEKQTSNQDFKPNELMSATGKNDTEDELDENQKGL